MPGSSTERKLGTDAQLRLGNLLVDLEARTVRARGTLLTLTAKEFDLLAFFAARPGLIFSREQLLSSVWHSSADWQQIATVTEHVHRLRSKIEDDPSHPQSLVTVRGHGYRFDAPKPVHSTAADRPRTGSIIHVDSRVVAADDGAVALLAANSRADIVGLHVLELIAPESKAAASERLRAAHGPGHHRSQLMTLRRLDGENIAVEIETSGSTWNQQPASNAIITDVSDDVARLSQLTGLFIAVSDAVFMIDMRSHIRSWNAAATRLYGWGEHEVIGRHILDILSWEAVEVDPSDAAPYANGPWRGAGYQRTRDGVRVLVEASMTEVRGDDGIAIGEIFVNRSLRRQVIDDPHPLAG